MAFENFMQIVSTDDFRERPVDLMDFVNGEEYMNMPEIGLSKYQQVVIEKSTQIFRPSSLRYLYGEQEGSRRAAASVNEVICQIGKGGGKNFVSTLSVAFLIYKLLCLKDPHRYYGKPRGDSIDLLNIAINSTQAANNFFIPFSARVKDSPWFRDKIDQQRGSDMVFEKNIHAYSGHSEREGWEGYNLIACVLDEIAGFSTDTSSDNPNAKTAEKIYLTYRASVTSRYPDVGKLILLSFPRYKGDFISKRYEEVVEQFKRNTENVTLLRNEELPASYPGNAFELQYEVDEILAYKEPRVFALRRPSFMFNPERKLEDYKSDIFYNPVDALTRFFCMPPDAESAFFRNVQPLIKQFGEESTMQSPFIDNTWQFRPSFKPEPDKEYFIHVDIGYAHDRAALAMAHVDSWVQQRNFAAQEPVPRVVVDCLRYWTPTSENNVSLDDIKQFILQLRHMGFNISRVTFDQFQSVQIIQELNAMNMFAEKLSVQKPHYGEFAVVLYDERIQGYRDDILLDEFVGLRLLKGNKVDHPVKGSNDLADAVVGAVFNAVKYSEQPAGEIEIRTYASVREERKNPIEAEAKQKPPPPPADIADFIQRMKVI